VLLDPVAGPGEPGRHRHVGHVSAGHDSVSTLGNQYLGRFDEQVAGVALELLLRDDADLANESPGARLAGP